MTKVNLKVSKTVVIKLRENRDIALRLGKGVDRENFDKHRRIGSAFRKNAILTGLTFAEEVCYLPEIHGVSHKDVGFRKACQDYWADISIEIPPGDRFDRGGGLELEVGFEYMSADGKIAGEKEATSELVEWERALEGGKEYEMDFTIRNEHGRPLNLSNFIAWRFALLHPHVANIPGLAKSSPRIKFYLHSREVEARNSKAQQEVRMRAFKAFQSLQKDRARVPDILLLMKAQVSFIADKDKKDYDLRDVGDQDLVLEKLASNYPAIFLNIVNDITLVDKAFIERCVSKGILRRVANTNTIIYADKTIGFDTRECVAFIRNPKNIVTLQELESKLKTQASLNRV